MTGGGGLAGIDVADNDDVDVGLVFLTVGGLKSVSGRGSRSRGRSGSQRVAAAATTR